MADERQPGFDDVPTLKEQGIDFSLGAWRGYGAPAGTPDCVMDVLDEALGNVAESPEFVEVMENTNSAITYMDAAETAEYWQQQDEYMAELIDQMGIATN
jgi:tripartite-type tricarboxylate transporter receptor subunit TctC